MWTLRGGVYGPSEGHITFVLDEDAVYDHHAVEISFGLSHIHNGQPIYHVTLTYDAHPDIIANGEKVIYIFMDAEACRKTFMILKSVWCKDEQREACLNALEVKQWL